MTLRNTLTEIQRVITAVFKKIGLATSDLRKNFKITFKKDQLSITAPYYLYWVDQGRKPSEKLPPFEPIYKWVKKQNFKLEDGQTLRDITFSVMKSISEKGYKGKFFLEPLLQQIQIIIENYLKTFIDKTKL